MPDTLADLNEKLEVMLADLTSSADTLACVVQWMREHGFTVKMPDEVGEGE